MAQPLESTTLSCGFPPIARRDARVLVLGSMPSVASLAKGEYYAHPRNAFWPIMGHLFGAGPDIRYRERQRILREERVAVWDVLKQCARLGSLDTAIDPDSEIPNDFGTFFRRHSSISAVFFNGGKAEAAFRKHAAANVARLGRSLHYVRLPSTSPAHAGRSFEEKLVAWRQIIVALQRRG
jgi:hypoxanthine-DNA glycosylase